MVKNIPIGKVSIKRAPIVPPLLMPMLNAAEKGAPLEPVMASICSSLGFDTFVFGMALSPIVTNEQQIFVFTTLPVEWVARYDHFDYVEVDPRVLKTCDSRLPLLWDQASERGVDAATDAFLDDALAHGIGSGISIEFNDSNYLHGMMALNSKLPQLTEERRRQIAVHLGDILLLGAYFQEILRKSVEDLHMPAIARDAPLSARQKQCLEMAARGLTNEDIALKLGITPRTAQFHFDSIRAKLNAANRQEAVARAIKKGIIKGNTLW